MSNLKGKKVYFEGITASDAFGEASADELKALIALAEANGSLSGIDELAKAAGITKLRATAAVALWEEAGAFEPKGGIEYEFESAPEEGTDEEEAIEVAKTLRRTELKELIKELQSLMGRAALSTSEVKRITSMVTQLALSEEYILTLAAYLEERGQLTVLKLHRRAEELSGSGIDTTEDLEIWIKEKSNKPLPHHIEFCKGLGYSPRALTRTEKEYADRWVVSFGFGEAIIGEALNITVINTGGKKSLTYIDKLLEAWHGAGCKTVAECTENYKAGKPMAKEKSTAVKKDGRAPKFSDFNADDALMKALERSYGSANDKK